MILRYWVLWPLQRLSRVVEVTSSRFDQVVACLWRVGCSVVDYEMGYTEIIVIVVKYWLAAKTNCVRVASPITLLKEENFAEKDKNKSAMI